MVLQTQTELPQNALQSAVLPGVPSPGWHPQDCTASKVRTNIYCHSVHFCRPQLSARSYTEMHIRRESKVVGKTVCFGEAESEAVT